MKKAKFALTAVAVVAVIGGALAFKANRTSQAFYGFGTVNGKVGCLVTTDLSYITTDNGAITPYSIATKLTPANDCAATVLRVQ